MSISIDNVCLKYSLLKENTIIKIPEIIIDMIPFKIIVITGFHAGIQLQIKETTPINVDPVSRTLNKKVLKID